MNLSGYIFCTSNGDGGANMQHPTYVETYLRPVVVISADIPLEDLEIGNYWTY